MIDRMVSRENLRFIPWFDNYAFGMFLIISVVRLSFPLSTSSRRTSLLTSIVPGEPVRLRLPAYRLFGRWGLLCDVRGVPWRWERCERWGEVRWIEGEVCLGVGELPKGLDDRWSGGFADSNCVLDDESEVLDDAGGGFTEVIWEFTDPNGGLMDLKEVLDEESWDGPEDKDTFPIGIHWIREKYNLYPGNLQQAQNKREKWQSLRRKKDD